MRTAKIRPDLTLGKGEFERALIPFPFPFECLPCTLQATSIPRYLAWLGTWLTLVYTEASHEQAKYLSKPSTSVH